MSESPDIIQAARRLEARILTNEHRATALKRVIGKAMKMAEELEDNVAGDRRELEFLLQQLPEASKLEPGASAP